MCRGRITVTLFLYLSFSACYGQKSSVLTRNHPENDQTRSFVEVKWYSPAMFGVNLYKVYRKEATAAAWQLLTTQPIKREASIPPEELAADEELLFFQNVLSDAGANGVEEDFVKLNILLKSFESTPFSKFLGIYLLDKTAEEGRQYQYRVSIVNPGGEAVLGESKVITAGLYQPLPAVEGFTAFQSGTEVHFDWEQNQALFYAYHLFQRDSAVGSLQLNRQPVLLTLQADSAGGLVEPSPKFKQRGYREASAYSFYIRGVDYFGGQSLASPEATVQVGDVTPPPAPSGLRGKVDSLRVTLQWEQQPVEDLKGFSVYRATKSDGPFENVSVVHISVDSLHYRELLLAPGRYYYYVVAEDHAGNTSSSLPIFLEAPDVFPPATPKNLTIQADTGRFYLSWDKNPEPDLAGYLVYRTINPAQHDGYVLLSAEPIDTTFYEQILPKNVKNRFHYFIVAIDTSYNRSKPSEVAVSRLPDVVPPETPGVSRIAYSEEGIIVEWVGNVDDDLAGYHVFRADSSKGSATRMNQALLGPGVFRFTDRQANPNTGYHYMLQALDSAGNGSDMSAPAYAYWYKEESLDSQLTLRLKNQKRKKANRLQWTEIEAPQLRGYVVFRGKNERSVKPITDLLPNATAYTDKSLSENSYVYQVRAYASSGQVIYSKTVEWREK